MITNNLLLNLAISLTKTPDNNHYLAAPPPLFAGQPDNQHKCNIEKHTQIDPLLSVTSVETGSDIAWDIHHNTHHLAHAE